MKTVIIIAALVAASVVLLEVDGKHQFDFRNCGGASRCLGASRLERLRIRSGHTHKSHDELAKELDDDDDLGVDAGNDMLVFACRGLSGRHVNPITRSSRTSEQHHRHHHRSLKGLIPAAAAGEIASGWMPSKPDAAISLAQAFNLHSRPNATRKIMLDFDGSVTQNSAWNIRNGQTTIRTPPYDKDGNPSTFSAGELSDILAIWRSVSEDFAPWDVDVTTQDPGATYLLVNGMRVAIGGSSTDWYGEPAGGVAYVGVFGKYNAYYSPAFIPAQLGPFYAQWVAEAVAHEVGHTLGLSHDGQKAGGTVLKGTAYYEGQGTFAPVMGASYNKPVTQWSKGEYLNANNLEDDIAIISTYLGPVTAIPQQYGSSMAIASMLLGTTDATNKTATARASGIIRRSTDTVAFSVQAASSGPITVRLLGVAAWGTVPRSNLNATVTVRNAQGTVLAAASGVGVGPLTVNAPAAGVYYIMVTPTGAGDPLTTGYSAYGSIGQHELVVTYPTLLSVSPSPSPSIQPSPVPSPQPYASPSPSPVPSPALSPSPSPTPSPSPAPSPSPSPSPTLSPSPSPSPSPAPSTSPSPSPSPSPAFSPSPSPPPSPSPSPAPTPATNVMNVSSIQVTMSQASSKVTCKAVVTIVLSYNKAGLSGVSVAGTWQSLLPSSGWPSTTSTSSTGRSGSSLGVVSFTASSTLPATPGNGCSFRVTSWTKRRMVQDSSAVLGPVGLKW